MSYCEVVENPSQVLQDIIHLTPRGTKTHTPIPHYLAYRITEEAIKACGYGVRRRHLSFLPGQDRVTKDLMPHASAFMQWEIDYMVSEGVYLQVGMRNSHIMLCSWEVLAGIIVTVCSNMVWAGEFRAKTIHSGNFDNILSSGEDRALQVVGGLGKYSVDQAKEIEMMRETPCSEDDARRIMFEAHHAGVLPWRDIEKVKDGWEIPRESRIMDRHAIHEARSEYDDTPIDPPSEQEKYPGSFWSLHQEFTSVLGERFKKNPIDNSSRLMKVNQIFMDPMVPKNFRIN